MLRFRVAVGGIGFGMITDMTLMRLMCARICHDLAAPAGAVAMGLEMLFEASQDGAMRDLVSASAQATIAKLEVFRYLTGLSGVENKPTGADLERALGAYWPDHKISVRWAGDLEKLQGTSARLALATILTAADGLSRGGRLTIDANFHITACGPMARLREESAQALTGQTSLSEQTAGTIIPFFAHALASSLGIRLHIQAIDETQFQIYRTEIS